MHGTKMDKRKLETAVACPIIYGSSAYYLGKKADEFATHRWTLYLRSIYNEDLSTFVEKVAFTLHPSFANPIVVIDRPPFEVSEVGWGEFECGLRVFFKDPNEQPIDIFHQLKLYPSGGLQSLNPKKPVIFENYDEIIFIEPTEWFYNCLMMYSPHSATYPTNKESNSTIDPNAIRKGMSEKNKLKQGQLMILDPPGEILETSAGGSAIPPSEQELIRTMNQFDDSQDAERLLAIHDFILSEIEAAKLKLLYLESKLVDEANHHQIPISSSQVNQISLSHSPYFNSSNPIAEGSDPTTLRDPSKSDDMMEIKSEPNSMKRDDKVQDMTHDSILVASEAKKPTNSRGKNVSSGNEKKTKKTKEQMNEELMRSSSMNPGMMGTLEMMNQMNSNDKSKKSRSKSSNPPVNKKIKMEETGEGGKKLPAKKKSAAPKTTGVVSNQGGMVPMTNMATTTSSSSSIMSSAIGSFNNSSMAAMYGLSKDGVISSTPVLSNVQLPSILTNTSSSIQKSSDVSNPPSNRSFS